MKLRPFELVLVVVFILLFIVSLLLLKTYKPPVKEGESQIGAVNIWGVLPADVMNGVLKEISDADKGFINVSYRYIPIDNFDDTFVNALADQIAPDLILIPHELLVKHRARLQVTTYETYPLRDFRNTFIDGADVFALSDGLYGFPLAVDPLVLYWNRDIFNSNSFLVPPKTWEEIVSTYVPSLILRDYNRTINRAAIAMGEYGNIKNAFPILSMLLLQGGSTMVTEEKNQYKVRLDETASNGTRPLGNAVTYYTNFSNINNTLYSWNRSLRQDKEMFLSEDLVIYFGLASEGRDIAAKNPNLSFDIAEVPQGAGSTVKRTYGTFYGLAIPKSAKNKAGALAVVPILTSAANAKTIADGYGLAPVQRSLLQAGTNDVYGRIAYASALYARGWLSPAPDLIGSVWSKMIDDINANRSDIQAATNDAVNRTAQLYK